MEVAPWSDTNDNLWGVGSVPEKLKDLQVQDVSSHLEAWSKGERMFSRLSWCDTLRNVRIAEELRKKEPTLVVEVGCGYDHPIGRMIAGMGIDTHYVGIDVVEEHAERVLEEAGKRPFAGVQHDINAGLPFHDNVIDVLLSMEMLAQAIREQEELEDFFREVARVLCPRWGIFYLATPVRGVPAPLQHPHCHTSEWRSGDILESSEAAGLQMVDCYNYRAKPQIAHTIRMRKAAQLNALGRNGILGENGLPQAAVDAYWLPILTRGFVNLVPGNAVYTFIRKQQ